MVKLLELPWEIRDNIWIQCSTTDSTVLGPEASIQYTPDSPFKMLSTCHMVHDELAHYLYGQPLFRFMSAHKTLEWMRTIGPHHSSQIRRISINIHASWNYRDSKHAKNRKVGHQRWAEVLQAAPNLEELTFDYLEGYPEWASCVFDADVSPPFAKVFQSLSNLQHLSYLGTSSSDLTILKSIPNLRTFRMMDNKLAPINRHQTSLQGLEALRLGIPFQYGDTFTTPWNLRGKATHKLITPSPSRFVSYGPLPCAKGHQRSPGVAVTVMRELSETEFTLAQVNCYPCPLAPDLDYLEIQVGDYTSELTRLPPSVKYLAISMVLPGICGETENHLHDMMLRCPNLVSLEVGVFEHLSRTKSSILNIGHPVRRVLEEIHNKGTSVHLFVQQVRPRLHVSDDGEHVDQSGLIP